MLLRTVLCALLLAAAPGFIGIGARAQQQPVLLVFGDSLAAGYGLPQGRGWVDLLQKKLAQAGYGYKVVNASISGETSLGGRNRLPAALAQHRPRIVILELGANDGLRGQPVTALRDNLVTMIRASTRAGAKPLLIGMRIPPNYGQAYTRQFESVFTQVARTQRIALVPFLLEGFADQRDLFQQDGIHPSEQAQGLILATVWNALEPMLRSRAKTSAEGRQRSRIARARPVLTLRLCHFPPARERSVCAPRPGHRHPAATLRHVDRRPHAVRVRTRPHSGGLQPAGAIG